VLENHIQVPRERVVPATNTWNIITGELTYGNSRCRFKINKQYFERKEFPRKKAEDIIGGADAWKNVDKMDGSSLHFPCLPYNPSSSFFLFSNLLFQKKELGAMILTSHDVITNTQPPQRNAQTPTAATTRLSSDRCRFALLMVCCFRLTYNLSNPPICHPDIRFSLHLLHRLTVANRTPDPIPKMHEMLSRVARESVKRLVCPGRQARRQTGR